MRTTRTRPVLGALCAATAAAALLTACGSSNPNPEFGQSAASAGGTEALSGITCTKAPSTPTSAPSDLKLPSKAAVEGRTYLARIQTNCGAISIELDGTKAPQTVASFLQLAQKYWVDNPCHRLTTTSIFVLRCGSATATPGYSFGVENAPENGDYPARTVAMARSESIDSNGGQFFIVYADTKLPTDTGGYTVFGKVVAGFDIVQAIAKAGTRDGSGDGAPEQPISIMQITVTEKKA